MDGSYIFPRSNRFGLFPAVSAGWRISDEPFFPQSTTLNRLRLRMAYGASGLQPGVTDALRYFSGVAVAADGGEQPGVTLAGLGNADLKPERSTEIEAGFDVLDSAAINLFFDGSPVPQISAMAPMRTSEAIPPISPNNAQITYSLTSYPLPDVAAAGTTTANLARPVELTEFSMADPGLFNLDLVDSHEIGSNGEIDFVASLTLAVGHKN